MYKSFFGLQKNPFNINPDPTYLCLTPQLEESLAELQYGMETRKGLMLLTGEAGTGKTTLVNHLLLWLEHQKARTAFIFNSHVDSAQLFDFILSDFEIPVSAHANANPLLVFNEWLLARFQSRELVVLIVDEAQGLPRQVLEEIRLLSNMETPGEKLLQILLVGQPELETKLRRPDLRQLQQRIELRCKTSPLTLRETQNYIESRLHTAGSRNATGIFSFEAVEAVHSYSRGIPRVINLLCENAMVCAYVEHQRRILAPVIFEAAREMQFDEYKPLSPRVTVFPQPAEPIDLRTLLGRFAVEAAEEDRRNAEAAFSSLPGLHGAGARSGLGPVPVPRAASLNLREQWVESTSGELDTGAMAENFATENSGEPTTAISPRQARGWKQDRSGRFPHSMMADVRMAKDAAARFVRDLQIPEALEGASQRIQSVPWSEYRAAVGARLEDFSATLASEVRLGAAGMRHYAHEQALRLQKRWWWRQNSLEELYTESFLATAIVAVLMFLVARRVYPAQSWHHPALVVLAFALFLLSAVSAAFAVRILVGARESLREDALTVLNGAIRWLRAPMDSMQMRAVSSVSNKMTGQRRD